MAGEGENIRKPNRGCSSMGPHVDLIRTKADNFISICLITEFYCSAGSKLDGERRVLFIAHLKCQQTPHLLSFFHNRLDLMSH